MTRTAALAALSITTTAISSSAMAEDVQIEKLSLDATLGQIFKVNPNCPIIYRNGLPYQVCNFKLPLEIESEIKTLETK